MPVNNCFLAGGKGSSIKLLTHKLTVICFLGESNCSG